MEIPVKYQEMLDEIVPVERCATCEGDDTWRSKDGQLCRCVRRQADRVLRLHMKEMDKDKGLNLVDKVQIDAEHLRGIQLQ